MTFWFKICSQEFTEGTESLPKMKSSLPVLFGTWSVDPVDLGLPRCPSVSLGVPAWATKVRPGMAQSRSWHRHLSSQWPRCRDAVNVSPNPDKYIHISIIYINPDLYQSKWMQMAWRLYLWLPLDFSSCWENVIISGCLWINRSTRKWSKTGRCDVETEAAKFLSSLQPRSFIKPTRTQRKLSCAKR